MSKHNTHSNLLETGMRMFLQTGYNQTGIQAVLQEVGLPKGSFYCHFRSKEDFGLQVIEYYCRTQTSYLERYLGDESLSPLTRLRQYFEALCKQFEAQQYREGCLIGNLSQEMAEQSETFRLRLEEIFAQWHEHIVRCLEQAQATGEISTHLDAEAVAEFCLNSWEGALLKMKVTRSIAPLRVFLTILFESVLKG